MKKRKINKKNIIIIIVIFLLILIEIVNPIKLYNEHLLRKHNYSDSSIEVILENGLKNDVLGINYSSTLDRIFKDKNFDVNNFSIYKDLTYYELDNYVEIVNKLIKKGYNALDINNILRNSSLEDITDFLEKDYIEDISNFLKYDFAILNNYDRYVTYKENNNIDNELVVVYVNIGLDKEYYQDYKIVNEFSTDMLINKYNGLDENFIPNDLVSIDSSYAVDSKQKGNKEMVDAFIKMSNDAKQETGYKLLVRSGYRDYKNQENTYNLYLKTYGKKYAESYAAHAGFSEHQTGLAIDVKAESSNTFAGTKESKWLNENCYKYGFILRYQEDDTNITGYNYESWHYRYVGVDIATYIKENNMTFDEYYVRFLNK